jgi:hypothetical protein
VKCVGIRVKYLPSNNNNLLLGRALYTIAGFVQQ